MLPPFQARVGTHDYRLQWQTGHCSLSRGLRVDSSTYLRRWIQRHVASFSSLTRLICNCMSTFKSYKCKHVKKASNSQYWGLCINLFDIGEGRNNLPVYTIDETTRMGAKYFFKKLLRQLSQSHAIFGNLTRPSKNAWTTWENYISQNKIDLRMMSPKQQILFLTIIGKTFFYFYALYPIWNIQLCYFCFSLQC